MTGSRGFEHVKSAVMAFAKARGITDEDFDAFDEATGTFKWSTNWENNLDKDFDRDAMKMAGAIRLFERAIEADDLLAARAAPMRVAMYLHRLYNILEYLEDDIVKLTLDPRLQWPDFPADYVIPEEYGYQDRRS
jgi:hypothetical protein